MKKLYTHENRLIVFNLKNLLEEQGISCFIENEFSSSGAGVLAPVETWPEIWVSEDYQFEKAEKIITEMLRIKTHGVDWICSICSESNSENFNICWKCNSPVPEKNK